MGRLFGTDGIRGKANRYPMDSAMAFSVGQALTHLLRKNAPRPRVIIGKDTRISGYMLERSLEAGIASMGGNPHSVGVLPTPGVSYITSHLHAEAGVMISASHNPFQDNGLKIFSADGSKLSNERENVIEDLILDGNLSEMAVEPGEMGSGLLVENALEDYRLFLQNTLPKELSLKGMKMTIDTANGATYDIAPHVFRSLGAQVTAIHNKPNGLNINENCGSQFPQDLQKQVLANDSIAGLAFDGDGDRLIAVDEKGNTVTGDQILFICAKVLKDKGKLKNNLLVSTVMSNIGLTLACRKFNIEHYMSKVGDRYVLADMQRMGAIIGGENSGHTIFLDFHNTGDGILTAIQLTAAMIIEDKPLSELATLVEIHPQKMINVEVTGKPEISTLPRVMEIIRQAEAELGDQGRVLVRYSGTQDLCRVMVEGPTESDTDKYCRQIAEVVRAAIG